jgi:alpha-glucosidase (family GH31 glycosyl hydrolase)
VNGPNGLSIDAHPEAGLLINGEAADVRGKRCKNPSSCDLSFETTSGIRGELSIAVSAEEAILTVSSQIEGSSVAFQFGGATPAYGLGDHATWNRKFDTDVTGVTDYHFLSGQGSTRLVSNFVIYPKQHFATILVDPTEKIVVTDEKEIVQGVQHSHGPVSLHILFGDPHQIYRTYLRIRNAAGYPVLQPKYVMFGVGWEAFGALGWDTNAKTVKDNLDRYIADGYPLSFAVIGSGYWPKPKEFHETTSFGLVDQEKYPDMRLFLSQLHQEKLKVIFGLRISFIADGPFAKEGLQGGYFIHSAGRPTVFTGTWPRSPYYLLDTQNPKAVAWYLDLVSRWTGLGVDGFKEDYFSFSGFSLRDDKVDPVSDALMAKGNYLIERNGYLSSNGDLQRIEDFNFNQDQDRGPVNALALAYSGLPLVYPDIVGGTFAEKRFDTAPTPRMETYMMREAQWAALHSGMSLGQPPWSFPNPKVALTVRSAAQLHDRLQPYLFSQATRFVHDGFPWTMVPLPLAFPEDPNVYGRENNIVRAYEWMIGDSLLATPLYGNDYDSAITRDIYLPEGLWMEYDSGKMFQGPKLLRAYPLPIGKTPLFVGGPGVIAEKIGGNVVARVFSLGKEGHANIWLYPLVAPAHIEKHVQDWEHAVVFDQTARRRVAADWKNHALEFPIEAAHQYRIQ